MIIIFSSGSDKNRKNIKVKIVLLFLNNQFTCTTVSKQQAYYFTVPFILCRFKTYYILWHFSELWFLCVSLLTDHAHLRNMSLKNMLSCFLPSALTFLHLVTLHFLRTPFLKPATFHSLFIGGLMTNICSSEASDC